MTLARQVDLEESGNGGGGPSGHHSRDEDGHHASSETADHQQHHQQQQHSSGGHHQQVYSMLTPTRYIMRSDLYNHKGELDDSSYDTSKVNFGYYTIIFLKFLFLSLTLNFLPLDGSA